MYFMYVLVTMISLLSSAVVANDLVTSVSDTPPSTAFAEYLHPSRELSASEQIIVDRVMATLETRASSQPKRLWRQMKVITQKTWGTGAITSDYGAIKESIRYQISARDGVVNRTFTPYGMDWFLHDPEQFSVEDVTEKQMNGCFSECTDPDIQLIDKNMKAINSKIRKISHKQDKNHPIIIIDSVYDPNTFFTMWRIARERGDITSQITSKKYTTYAASTGEANDIGKKITSITFYEPYYEEMRFSFIPPSYSGALLIQRPFNMGPNIENKAYIKNIFHALDYEKNPY